MIEEVAVQVCCNKEQRSLNTGVFVQGFICSDFADIHVFISSPAVTSVSTWSVLNDIDLNSI